MSNRETEIRNLQKDWAENSRWQGIKRDYSCLLYTSRCV